jgi:hypothetical protein
MVWSRWARPLASMGTIRAMKITVVTTRDDLGAPATREVYAAADRYAIADGNLEVLSAKRELLALYGSGNWFSVFVNDSVKVISGGSEADLSTDLDFESDSDPASADLDVAAEPETGADAGFAATDADDNAFSYASPDEADTAQTAGDVPARSEAGERDRVRPATPPAETGRPPWMRPVAFGPKALKPRKDDAGRADPSSRMRPVAFGPKALEPRKDDAGPADPRSRMRQVVIRPRTYRAAPPQAEPPAQADPGDVDSGSED